MKKHSTISRLMLTLFFFPFTMIAQTTKEDVKEETKEAVHTTESYVEHELTEAQMEMRKNIDQLDHEIARLEAKAEKVNRNTESRIENNIEMIDQRRDELVARYESLEDRSRNDVEAIQDELREWTNGVAQETDELIQETDEELEKVE